MTSDCKLWPAGGNMAICDSCGVLQAIVDSEWRSEADAIYQNYDTRILGEGIEQAVVFAGSQNSSPRSVALLDHVQSQIEIPETGRLLDVGCGNGSFLRAFGMVRPRWSLFGADRDDSFNSAVRSIDGVEQLYTCPIREIPEKFDVIVMVHSLEHIPEPVEFLTNLADRLTEGGHVIVQLPYFLHNPVYLFVADHCSHFTQSSAVDVLRRAGFVAVDATTRHVSKELTIIARKSEAEQPRPADHGAPQTVQVVQRLLEWSRSVSNSARDLSQRRPFGLWGSSVTATWLFAEIDGNMDFFVDDSPTRQGQTFLDRPVLAPTQVPAGSRVYLGLAPIVADQIWLRMKDADIDLHKPEMIDLGPLTTSDSDIIA